jgi:hypothetical protein
MDEVRFEYLAHFDLEFYFENKGLETHFLQYFILILKGITQWENCVLISFNFVLLNSYV